MANVIPSGMQENIVIMGTEFLSETMAVLEGVAMNAAPTPANKGDTFTVSKYATLTATDVTPANVSPAASAITFGSSSISLDYHKKANFALTGREFAENNLDRSFQQQFRESVRACVSHANSTLCGLYKRIPYLAGNAARSLFNNGTAASADVLADVKKVLRDNRVNVERARLYISPTEEAAAQKVPNLQAANTYGARDVIYDGYIGRAMGFDIFVDQDIATHTTGTITNSISTKSGATPLKGDTTLVVTVSATVGSAIALVDGDVISAGNYTYAITGPYSATPSQDVTLTLDRGLEEALTAGGGDIVTLATGHGTGEVGIAGDMTGFGLVNRLEAVGFYGGVAAGTHVVITHPSGISLLAGVYEQYHQIMWETQLLYGVSAIDTRKLVRALGA